ncbi:Protein phosphatase Slingshot [Atta colombica]|uniref:Protein phosphatase Slingshot n=1 Tax=Atta colombica TaxID=520822 RepID=A0A195BJG2_9HYME|nr:Protein phosphatase Slingshot [Atta colombica]
MIVLKQKAGLHYSLPPPSPPQPPSPWSSILRGDDRRPRRCGRRVACGVRVTQLRDKVIAKVRFHAGRTRYRVFILLRSFLLIVSLSLLTQTELFVLSTEIRQMAIINFRIERLRDSGAGAPADDEDTTRSCKSLSECYFAGKGAALVLPPNERARPSRRVSAAGCDIQQHLQSMFYLLRPEETLKMNWQLQIGTSFDVSRTRMAKSRDFHVQAATNSCAIYGSDCGIISRTCLDVFSLRHGRTCPQLCAFAKLAALAIVHLHCRSLDSSALRARLYNSARPPPRHRRGTRQNRVNKQAYLDTLYLPSRSLERGKEVGNRYYLETCSDIIRDFTSQSWYLIF